MIKNEKNIYWKRFNNNKVLIKHFRKILNNIWVKNEINW